MAAGNNFKDWPKVPEGPPGGLKFPDVPVHTIEREISQYALTHTNNGYMQLFYEFLVYTRSAIFRYGATGPKGKPLPSQILLDGYGKLVDDILRKPTNELRIAAMNQALTYLKTHYERLFPQNRLIGAPGPSRVVPVDNFLIAKWRQISLGGSFESFNTNSHMRALKERTAKLKYEGGRRKTHRRSVNRKRTRRAARK